ncbi:MAG: hypothetical protein AAFV72_24485 [Cyanobacteria bacterium J06635_1]
MDTQLDLLSEATTAQLTLQEANERLNLNEPGEIPLIIRLFENPESPIALPGNISLYGHDCLYILFNRGISLADEAFIIGFTMGNDTKTRQLHVAPTATKPFRN